MGAERDSAAFVPAPGIESLWFLGNREGGLFPPYAVRVVVCGGAEGRGGAAGSSGFSLFSSCNKIDNKYITVNRLIRLH